MYLRMLPYFRQSLFALRRRIMADVTPAPEPQTVAIRLLRSGWNNRPVGAVIPAVPRGSAEYRIKIGLAELVTDEELAAIELAKRKASAKVLRG